MPIRFLVAFKITACRGSVGGLAPSMLEAQTLGGSGDTMLPLESFQIGLSKKQFPAFAELELISWEGLLRKFFRNAQKQVMKYYFVFAINYYNINQK